MTITIHRGTHQIGGIATEIRTEKTRIIIDMGDELSLEDDFISRPLNIPGVTDGDGSCDAVLFTHYHGDHTKQLDRVREDIPLYGGALMKKLLLISEEKQQQNDQYLKRPKEEQEKTANRIARIREMKSFSGRQAFAIGDITITPIPADHNAVDAYMFLIEADGKRVLYTGDFRVHGFRGKELLATLKNDVRRCDVLICEGTTVTREGDHEKPEDELIRQLTEEYIPNHKYVYVLAATTNIDRIFAVMHAVPRGRYFICDDYQKGLIETVADYYDRKGLYSIPKITTFGENFLPKFRKQGFVMLVRQNGRFAEWIRKLDAKDSLMLYSMWDGYRTKEGSQIPAFLELADSWKPWHTSGHASKEDIGEVIRLLKPSVIIPMHTESPELMREIYDDERVVVLGDGEAHGVE